jgi:hypothetical protein
VSKDLLAVGLSPATLHDLSGELRGHLDRVALLFFKAIAENVPGLVDAVLRAGAASSAAQPGNDTPAVDDAAAAAIEAQIIGVVNLLRPHATRAVDAMLALALRERAEKTIRQLRSGWPGNRLEPDGDEAAAPADEAEEAAEAEEAEEAEEAAEVSP